MAEAASQIQGDGKDTQLTSGTSSKQIIGLLPRSDSPGSLNKLYTTSNDTTTNTAGSPINVHSFSFDESPPADLVEHFLVDQSGSVLSAGTKGSKPELSVIISTESGAKQASDFFEKALEPVLKAYGLHQDYKVYKTETEHSITELSRSVFAPKAAQGINQTIILLSGDGGTIDLVNELIEHSSSSEYVRPTLVPLPLGSGNALSNSYKYQQDDTFGLSTLLQGKRRPLPMFRVTFSSGARTVVNEGREERELATYQGKPTMFGVVVCSWGLHSTLVAESDTSHWRQFGTARFGMVAKELLFPPDGGAPHEFKGSVNISPPTSAYAAREQHSYVLATLVSNLEKTFCISPDSKALDGKLRLVEMPPMPGQELYDTMIAAYDDGKHVSKDKVGYHAIDQLEIHFDEDDERWRRVCVDGKIVKMERGGSLRLEKEKTVVADVVCLQ